MKNVTYEDDLTKRPVEIMGKRQRVYVRECVPAYAKHIPQQKTEVVLQQVDLPTGFYQRLVEREYPINSETVSSYADTADYRNDPLGAIAKAPKRVNLGDITGVQDFMNGDPQRAIAQYREVLGKLSDYLAHQANVAPIPPSGENPANGGENK